MCCNVSIKKIHWRIQGGATACTPPTGSISFIFTYVFAKKYTHQRLVPPQWVSAPPQWEILDPPLKYTHNYTYDAGLTLPSLLTYIYATHLMTFTAKGAPHLQFVHSSVLKVYIYV